MARFYSQLSHSFGTEDYRTVHQALQIKPKDRVLCITGSSETPLHLLLRECKEILSVDPNPVQTHLLELKAVALKKLSYENYLAFLGAIPFEERLQFWIDIEKDLSDEAREFWQRHKKMLAQGVIYQGALEKFCSRLAKITQLTRKDKAAALFDFDQLEQQKGYFAKKWNTRGWKTVFDLTALSFSSPVFINNPELYNDLAPYVIQRIEQSLQQGLAKNNALVSLALKGKVEKEAFPPYLTKKGQNLIKTRLDRLKFYTDDIIPFLQKQKSHSIDAFSFSDISSKFTKVDFGKLCEEVVRTAKKDSRFIFKQFLSDHRIPESFAQHFQRDSLLENSLEKEDRSCVYRFIVGHIEKNH